MTIIYVVVGTIVGLVLYLKIGEKIATQWYIPKVQAIAINSLINLKQKDLDEIENDMRNYWLVLAPIEVISDCLLFRFSY